MARAIKRARNADLLGCMWNFRVESDPTLIRELGFGVWGFPQCSADRVVAVAIVILAPLAITAAAATARAAVKVVSVPGVLLPSRWPQSKAGGDQAPTW